ncbi:FAD-dependent oxidoreductase [Spirosoma sp. BT702]|uniref:NADH:ubiquinone reductase (non-electrogenic) n=1 Tax=Spirosoma profusum TaxID=2771354 RepID=A0A926Y0L4_9BACT|nr:FAD-dependent oxidoreductase [Spirosoma profusum]MBD2699591.1 FAD-dependent oxidoreductase [Spirosoma profusum]
MQSSPTQIVFLGGGYVSVWAYRTMANMLRSQMANGQVTVTVICPHAYHFYHGWTAESLTDIIRDHNRLSPLTEIMPKANLILGEAEKLDHSAQVVHIRTKNGDQQTLRYDHLLMGIGSFDSEAVEGIRTYGYQIKSPEAFQRTRNKLHQLVKEAAQADPEQARQLLSFTVAGGGFAGVELVTNLAEWVNLAKKSYPGLSNLQPQIRLVNSGNQVLSALQPDYKRLIRYTEKTMRKYGIALINNAKLTKVTSDGAFLSDGTFLESSLVLSTVGQSRFTLAGTEPMPRDTLQRLYTNAYQQVDNLPNVWGGGDACHVAHYQTGIACPANALWAIKHGEYVGRNIARAVKGKKLKPFTYRGLGQSASLGLGKGITEMYGVQFTGALAWIMRWFFFHYFMPSRRLMLDTVGDWFHLLFRGKRKGAADATTDVQTNPIQAVAA